MIMKIVKIGNSKGIRIPNHVLNELQIKDNIELIVNDKKDELVLRPVKKTRSDWGESFKKMKQTGHDKLIIDDSLDLKNWEW